MKLLLCLKFLLPGMTETDFKKCTFRDMIIFLENIILVFNLIKTHFTICKNRAGVRIGVAPCYRGFRIGTEDHSIVMRYAVNIASRLQTATKE